MKTFFYSGAFDPFTALDAEIVFNTLKIHPYSKVVIGIELDSEKTPLFSVDKRMEMIKKSIEWYAKKCPLNSLERYLNDIVIVSYRGLPVYEAQKHNVTQFIVPDTDVENPKYDVKYVLSRQIARRMFSHHIGYYVCYVTSAINDIAKSIELCFKNREYIMLAYHVTPPVHNMIMEELLESEYFDCCRQAGISWKDFCQEMSTRAYHNLSHIAYMLNLYRLRTTTDFYNDKIVKSAIFFHDYVLDSEAKSFEASKLSESAKGLFMATKRPGKHPDTLSADEQLIHDLDLAIFADECLYENYAYSIRMEYDGVAFNDYIVGRTMVLDEIKKEILKRTCFTDKEKEIALKNIEKEINYLAKGYCPQ